MPRIIESNPSRAVCVADLTDNNYTHLGYINDCEQIELLVEFNSTNREAFYAFVEIEDPLCGTRYAADSIGEAVVKAIKDDRKVYCENSFLDLCNEILGADQPEKSNNE